MSLNAFLKIKGEIQGNIDGSVTQKGREKTIKVFESHHELNQPIELISGYVTGKRVHKPFTIVKEVDKSTPKLYKAMTSNEKLTEWECKYFQKKTASQEVNFYTVKLTDARIVNIKFLQPDTIDPDTKIFPENEEVSFIYKKIEWIFTDGNISASDEIESEIN
ncbi:MAG: type VI secretion system tube protein Hcp [Ignavibacteria bacterium]|nr:type VI secretion system tube protein Hcp [Ignavibacteria bacterium]